MSVISEHTFEALCRASVDAVALVEGWDGKHPAIASWEPWPMPSRAYRAELRRQLRRMGIRVAPKGREF